MSRCLKMLARYDMNHERAGDQYIDDVFSGNLQDSSDNEEDDNKEEEDELEPGSNKVASSVPSKPSSNSEQKTSHKQCTSPAKPQTKTPVSKSKSKVSSRSRINEISSSSEEEEEDDEENRQSSSDSSKNSTPLSKPQSSSSSSSSSTPYNKHASSSSTKLSGKKRKQITTSKSSQLPNKKTQFNNNDNNNSSPVSSSSKPFKSARTPSGSSKKLHKQEVFEILSSTEEEDEDEEEDSDQDEEESSSQSSLSDEPAPSKVKTKVFPTKNQKKTLAKSKRIKIGYRQKNKGKGNNVNTRALDEMDEGDDSDNNEDILISQQRPPSSNNNRTKSSKSSSRNQNQNKKAIVELNQSSSSSSGSGSEEGSEPDNSENDQEILSISHHKKRQKTDNSSSHKLVKTSTLSSNNSKKKGVTSRNLSSGRALSTTRNNGTAGKKRKLVDPKTRAEIDKRRNTLKAFKELRDALRHAKPDKVKTLLQEGIDPNKLTNMGGVMKSQHNSSQFSSVHFALPWNDNDKDTEAHVESLELLKKYDADFDEMDYEGLTAIHWSCKHRFNLCLPILLKYGNEAAVNRPSPYFDDQPPLQIAVAAGGATSARILIEHNADVNQLDGKFGETALHVCLCLFVSRVLSLSYLVFYMM